jgi:ubiquinol-cytochrome c reductase cytochrome b subunit
MQQIIINLLVSLRDWVDARLPIVRAWNTHMGQYYAPKNFNFWYVFGVLSLLVLVNQLATGVWLTMSFVPDSGKAFASVEYIMRDVEYGAILRYMHSTGASAFFAVVYLHMFRGVLYGSYRKPRELVWLFGIGIYVCLMAEGFLGYVLPWGQMSYWGAQVIVSLFGAIPVIGPDIVEWVRGDFLISSITLNRFFALHVIAIPLALVGLVVMHLLALHEVGSNNPDGVEIKKNKDKNGIPLDGIPFHPYYTIHDLVPIVVFLFVFCTIIFFVPEMGGYFLEPPNFEEANPLKTPAHIAPVWYYGPFYSMLRAVTYSYNDVFTAKFLGFIVMGAAIAILAVLPWLDKSPVKSIRYKGMFTKTMVLLFVVAFVILGVLGTKSATPNRTMLAQVLTTFYFAFFICMPVWTNKYSSSFYTLLRWPLCVLFGGLFIVLSVQSIKVNLFIRAIGICFAVFFFVMPFLIARDDVKQEPERVTMNGGLNFIQSCLVFFLVAILVFLPLKAAGAESAHSCGAIECYDFQEDFSDKASLQRGMTAFMGYCMGCHSVQYSRYERVAEDLDIPVELMEKHVLLQGQKIGNLMKVGMSHEDSKEWFGVAPPDLTMITRTKKIGPSWLYTYLQTFYLDDKRPYGVNNLVFKNVGMPNVLQELQGDQECRPPFARAENGGIKKDVITGEKLEDSSQPCARVIPIKGTESISNEEFDRVAYDITNFLAYTANPVKSKHKRIGVFVLLFLAFLFVWVWLLNREYWKDIH